MSSDRFDPVARGPAPGGAEWETLSDEEVVARVRQGEAALFEALMRRHNRRLYRVARSILRDGAEAEDVMQHAYVEAYRHLGQFAGRSSFATWLTRIAVHEALARARRRARERRAEPGEGTSEDTMSMLPSPRPDPEALALQAEARALLETAVDALPTRYRSVFVLREVEGLGTADTARCLDLTDETVKTRLHRARALLRRDLLARAGVAAPTAFSFDGARCDRVVAGVLSHLGLVTPARTH